MFWYSWLHWSPCYSTHSSISSKCIYKALIVVPNKIIITTELVVQSELKVIIEDYPNLFDESENADADFNILTLFILKERTKGKESFYYNWFAITDESYSMYSWTEDELEALDE